MQIIKENPSNLVGIRLCSERKRCGLTQAEAANSVGVSREMWGKYERGAKPGTNVLLRLATQGFDVPYILTGERTPAAALQAHINAAQFTIKKDLDEESVQLLAQSWRDQAPYSVATRAQEEDLLKLFRAMSEQSKLSLLAVAQSFK